MKILPPSMFAQTRAALRLSVHTPEMWQAGFGLFVVSLFIFVIFPQGKLEGLAFSVAVIWAAGFWLSTAAYLLGTTFAGTFHDIYENELALIFGKTTRFTDNAWREIKFGVQSRSGFKRLCGQLTPALRQSPLLIAGHHWTRLGMIGMFIFFVLPILIFLAVLGLAKLGAHFSL